jgi:hypothetical protein
MEDLDGCRHIAGWALLVLSLRSNDLFITTTKAAPGGRRLISAQQNTGALKPVSRQLSRQCRKAFYRHARNLTESSQTAITVALLSQLHDSPQRRRHASSRNLSDYPKNLQCRTSARKTLLTKNERSCQIHLAITHGACLKTAPQRALQAAIE